MHDLSEWVLLGHLKSLKMDTYLNVALFFCGLPTKLSILPQDNLMACRLMKFLGIEWTWIRRKSSLLQWMCCFELFFVSCMFVNEVLLTAAVNFFPKVLDVSYWLSIFLKAFRRSESCLFISVLNSSFLDEFGRRSVIRVTLFSCFTRRTINNDSRMRTFSDTNKAKGFRRLRWNISKTKQIQRLWYL